MLMGAADAAFGRYILVENQMGRCAGCNLELLNLYHGGRDMQPRCALCSYLNILRDSILPARRISYRPDSSDPQFWFQGQLTVCKLAADVPTMLSPSN